MNVVLLGIIIFGNIVVISLFVALIYKGVIFLINKNKHDSARH